MTHNASIRTTALLNLIDCRSDVVSLHEDFIPELKMFTTTDLKAQERPVAQEQL